MQDTLNAFWRLILRKRRWAIGAIAGTSLLESALQVANLGMIIPFALVILGQADALESRVAQTFGPVGRMLLARPPLEAALWLAGGTLTLVLFRNALTIARNYVAFRLCIAVRTDITLQLFTRYLQARFAELGEIPKGTVLYNLAHPPMQVANIARVGSDALASAIQIAALVSLLLWLSWPLTVMAGATAGVALLVYQLMFSRRLQHVRERIYDADSRVYQWMSDAVDGMREVKAFAAADAIVARARELFRQVDSLEREHGRIRYVPGPLNEILSTAAALALFVVASFVPGFQIPFAYVVTFIVTLQRLGPACAMLLEQKSALDSARKNLSVTLDVLTMLPREPDDCAEPPPETIETIELERVTHVYPSREHARALNDVSVRFRRGEVTAVVGPSGAGKSTIADLIVRLIDPTSGRLLVNGRDLAAVELAGWRRRVGLVSQDPFLFNASIRDNIALSQPGASVDDVKRAAVAARIDEFVSTLPQGYDTLVGNRGAQLSGGQRQRIAIARALLSRPGVLIFDEATSALDSVSERLVRETIRDLRSTAIVIVIAHKASSVEAADTIVVLDEGEVVARGSHEELVQAGGLYTRMYPVARTT